jgi:peptidoglycan/xylan/chitin deacetylase (PgdA/CDA1 family)
MVVLVLALLLGSGPAVSVARSETVVSLNFDDGITSQYLARPLLAAHDMHATFYVNSGDVGESPFDLSWGQVDDLHADGHEIGGHTVDNVSLRDLAANPAEQRRQICDDADALRGRGYEITTFAYPFGVRLCDGAQARWPARTRLLELRPRGAAASGGCPARENSRFLESQQPD